MTIPRLLVASAAVVLLLLCAGPAAAQNCSISTTSLSFGTYDVFASANTDSTAVITFSCNRSLNITIFLSQGGATTFDPRRMTTTGDQITYNLYVDAARSSIWGDGTAGTSYYLQNNIPRNTNINVTVYGRVAALQDVSAGAYADTVVATINY